jgi:hypothetical protein
MYVCTYILAHIHTDVHASSFIAEGAGHERERPLVPPRKLGRDEVCLPLLLLPPQLKMGVRNRTILKFNLRVLIFYWNQIFCQYIKKFVEKSFVFFLQKKVDSKYNNIKYGQT